MKDNCPEVNGWLILDKPAGITSAKAVAAVKKVLKPKKIGHGGTLDPMATGILPLALGEATKAFQYVVMQEKSYRFTVKWGSETSTDDAEGEVISASDTRPTRADIENLLPQFIGTILQAPPRVSAIKIDGKRAYKRVRDGEDIEIPAREVNVMDLQLLESELEAGNAKLLKSADFIVHCGKGTYVRSLARDLGQKLGCLGHITALRRCSVGAFNEDGAISLDALQEINYEVALAMLHPIGKVLDDIPAISLEASQMKRLLHGQTASPVQAGIRFWREKTLRCHRLEDGKLLALGSPVGSLIKPIKVFNV